MAGKSTPQLCSSGPRSEETAACGLPCCTNSDSGIDEDQGAMAAENEIVDRQLLLRRHLLRMGNDQKIDIGRNGREIIGQGGDVIFLRQRGVGGQRLRVLGGAHHGQGCEQADGGLLGRGQMIDQRGQVIFQIGLALGREIGDGLMAVDAVGTGKAEIDHIAPVGGRGRQPGGAGLVLFRREGLRIDFLKDQLAMAERHILAQKVAHPLGVSGGRGIARAGGARIIEFQGHRLLQLGQDVARALAQGELAVLGQVQPRIGEEVIGEDVGADE